MKKKSKIYEFSEETILKRKIAITIGAIVSIVAIVVGVIFFTQNNNTKPKNPSKNISQNDENQVAVDDIMGMVESHPTVMKETIDLNSVDLTKYGLTNDNEISIPYPTSLGCAYVVRDYGKQEEKTYLFVTTEKDVMYVDTETVSAGRLSVENNGGGEFTLQRGDIDGEPGEEIVLLINTGGNGGAGIYLNSIWKIKDNEIKPIKISDEKPFKVSRKAPFTVVFENEELKYKKEFVCKTDSELLFDESGNPTFESDFYDGYSFSGDFYSPHEINVYPYGDETTDKCIVSFTSWSRLSRCGDETVESVVDYVFDEEKKELIIHDAYIDVYLYEDRYLLKNYETDEEYFASLTADNGYNYYDINNDGTDELIIHEKNDVKEYKVYIFADGKMYHSGTIFDDHGDLYGKDGMVTAVSRKWNDEDSGKTYSVYFTYEIVNNKLVEKENGKCEPLNEADDSQFGKKIELNKWYK